MTGVSPGSRGGAAGPQLDVSCSVATVARTNVPVLSLKILSDGKAEKCQKFSRLLAKMSLFFFRGSTPDPAGVVYDAHQTP